MLRDRRALPFASPCFLVRFFLLVLFGGHGCGGSGKDAATPPNIVVIMTDDQRWDELAFMPTVDGRSLVGLLRGTARSWREDFLIELLPHRKHASFAGVRTPEWKYIDIADVEPSEELYDLRRDPHEMDNLLHTRPGDPDVTAAVERLRARMVELKRE